MSVIAEETSVQRTIREHEVLRHRMAGIRKQAEEIASGLPGGTPGGPLESLLGSLDALQGALAAHFAFEEEGGLPDDLALRLPFVKGKAHGLRGEHARILERVKAVAEQGRAAPTSGAQAVARFSQGVLDLLETISLHEEHETTLIQEAYLDDLGGRG